MMKNTDAVNKTCTKCHKEQQVSEFWVDRSKKDGLKSNCITCMKKGAKAYRKTKHYRHVRRRYYYGITKSEYLEMFRRQNGKCAICGISHLELTKGLCVDHIHSINQIRGLLCQSCNCMLGMAKENRQILANAIKYLNKQQTARNCAKNINSS